MEWLLGLLDWVQSHWRWDWLAIWLAIAVLVFLIPPAKSAKAASEDPAIRAAKAAARRRMAWLLVLLSLSLVVWFGSSRWFEYRKQERYLQEDVAERKAAPPWNYTLAQFSRDDQRQVLEQRFRSEGYRVRCFAGKGGILPQDDSMCWFNVGSIDGVTAESAGFFFDDRGKLNAIRLSFPKDGYAEVSRYLSRTGQKLAATLGQDGLSGKPIEAWVFDQGLAMASESPDIQGSLMVYWIVRPLREIDVCSGAIIEGKNWRLPKAREQMKRELREDLRKYWQGLSC